MSCVVGIRQDRTIYMGGDGRLSSSSSMTAVAYPPKVVTYGQFIIGMAGAGRFTDLVYSAFRPPRDPMETDDYTYMVCNFIPALRRTLEEGGVDLDLAHDDGDMFQRPEPGELLVGWRGVIYMVGDDFSVNVAAESYAAIGSGDDAALGALYATQGWKRQEKRVLTALEAAARYVPSVGPPFTVEVLNG